MAKKPSKPNKPKEKIKPPTKPVLKIASKELRQGGKVGARVEAEESVAVRQGVVKKAAPPKKAPPKKVGPKKGPRKP